MKYVTKQIHSKNCFTSELQNYEGRIDLSSEIFIFLIFFRNGLYGFGLALFVRIAGGIEPGGPQGCQAPAPRGAEATSGATATPLGPRLTTADHW